ncbi:MAG: lactate utilization protein LutB domain-containing protein, partial [Paraburkholderia tropica]
AEQHELPFVKREAMKVAGQVLSHPTLYRAAIKGAGKAVATLPRAVLYNPLNAWGKQRELPDAPKQTFRDWYLKHNKRNKS